MNRKAVMVRNLMEAQLSWQGQVQMCHLIAFNGVNVAGISFEFLVEKKRKGGSSTGR